MIDVVLLFLCGDVMTGRGIDQILPHPSDPVLYEPYMKSARGYAELAQRMTGPIPQPVGFSYIWGDALGELERAGPDLRVINLETSVTKSDDHWEDKEIHYRMNPENIPCLAAARIDVCSLANNHVLDWGYAGLRETLETLRQAGIKTAGAGQNRREAEAPAIVPIKEKGRVVVLSLGCIKSGIPFDWGATEDGPGVSLLKALSDKEVQHLRGLVQEVKRPGDIVIASIHWGRNWGYEVPAEQREFAHRIISEAGIDVIHGHSSHHVKGIEVYQGKLILYGCGDFLDDYEGIRGYESFRDDLTLMYFASVDPSNGKLVSLRMTPMQIKHLKVNRASPPDAFSLMDILTREGGQWGTRARLNEDHTLTLEW